MSEVEIKIIPSSDPRLGRNVEHDPRSRAYAFKAPARLELHSVRHERFIPVLDQGNLGSCTGNSGVGAAGTHPFYPTLKDKVSDWSEAAAVQLYSEATVIDPWEGSYPPDDTGSSGLAVAKVLKDRGWISGYQHTFSFDDLCAALQNGPVLLGINWYNNFFYPNRDGVISVLSRDYVAGGHEVCVDEIDMERQRFGVTNSWGTGWGLEGRFYIPFDLMKRLLSEDGDVVVPVPLTQPAPVPTPSPDPVVEEVVDEDDKVLWEAVKDWAHARHYTDNKKAANAVKKWAASKGLTD